MFIGKKCSFTWIIEENIVFGLFISEEKKRSSWAWWHTPLIPALGRQRQSDFWVRGQPGLQSEFQDSQGYTEKPCLKNKTKKKQNKTKTKNKQTTTKKKTASIGGLVGLEARGCLHRRDVGSIHWTRELGYLWPVPFAEKILWCLAGWE